MNFLVTTTYKDSMWSQPPEKIQELAAAAIAFADKYHKAGKFKNSYSFANGKIISVWDVASVEEMFMILAMDHPYVGRHVVDYEVDTVLDHDTIARLAAETKAAGVNIFKK